MWNRFQLAPDRGLKKAPSPANDAPSVGVSRIGVAGRQPYPSVDSKTLQRGFNQNELAFACCDLRASAAGDASIQVLARQKDGSYQAIPGHPLRRLMIRPSAQYDEASFTRAAIASMDVCGVFYAERLLSGAGGLVGLNPLNPASVTAHYSGKDLIYRWQESGHAHVDFRPDELLIRRGDWTRPARMAVALSTIDGDSAQTDYVRSFFNNGGVPAGRIKVKGTINEDKANAIRSRWRAMFSRSGRQHDVAVFDDNGDYEKLGANLDELESAIVRGVSESRICMTFQVPPLIVYSYFGLSRSTYSNMDAAMRGFWMNTMSPLLKDWRGWLTWNLLREFESEENILSEQVRLGWDMSQVAALADNVEEMHKRSRDNYAAGLISQNEGRAGIGAAPLDGGDSTFVSRAPAGPLSIGGKSRKAKPKGTEKQMTSALEDYIGEQYQIAAGALA